MYYANIRNVLSLLVVLLKAISLIQADYVHVFLFVVTVKSFGQLMFSVFCPTCNSDAAYQWCPGEWPLCTDYHRCLC